MIRDTFRDSVRSYFEPLFTFKGKVVVATLSLNFAHGVLVYDLNLDGIDKKVSSVVSGAAVKVNEGEPNGPR